MTNLATPASLHIGPLAEGAPARISWDLVDNAAGYILERQFNGAFTQSAGRTWENLDNYAGLTWSQFEAQNLTWQQFELQSPSFEIFRGPGTAEQGSTWTELDDEKLTWPQFEAKNLTWDQFEHLLLHRSTMDAIAIGAKTAIYRIKAYAADGSESPFLTGSQLPVTPIFYRADSTQWQVTNGTRYWVLIEGENLRDLDRVPLTFRYSVDKLRLESFMAQLPGQQTAPGNYPAACLQINAAYQGEVQFSSTRQIPAGANWSGCITLIQFVAIGSGPAEVSLA